MDALKLLTLDCWREVLDRVKDPEDLKACSETCVIFEKLLMRKMNVFLFELILPNLFEYLAETIQVPGEAEGGDNFEAGGEVSWKSVYDCRAVCKDWCNSIDKFAGTNAYERLFQYWFGDGDTTERFLNMFETHVGNPFVGRRVVIVHRSTVLLAPPQQDDQYGVPQAEIFHIAKIRQLLSRFGKEIWALKLFERMENQHLTLCRNIPTVLRLLPNLRELRVACLFMRLQEENMDELPAYIADNPLPALPHLERMDVYHLNPVMVRTLLQKYSPQLKYLSTCYSDSSGFPEVFSRFRCLKELNLMGLDVRVSLQGLRQLHSPLERLYLRVEWNIYETIVWPIDELFRSIQHLPLRMLEISLPAIGVFFGESAPISPELRVRHESIREVRIACVNGTVSLNFLAYCPNLTIFTMHYLRVPLDLRGPRPVLGHPNGVAELVDVTELLDDTELLDATDILKEDRYDLYQSNIWEIIRSLKFLTMTDVCLGYRRHTEYNRMTYEQQNHKK